MAVRDLKATWENLGKTDPLWAVLSSPDRRYGRWDVAEFMATGNLEVQSIIDIAGEYRLSLGERVLDFGCGVGRLSNALAAVVPQVVGIDIAESMLEQATNFNQHPDRVEFCHYDGHTIPFPDNSFDSAVSLRVLQHMHPSRQLASLLELQRVVRPGGVLVLQIASGLTRAEPLAPEAMRAAIDVVSAPARMATNEKATIRARITNASTQVWPLLRMVKLGNHWRRGNTFIRYDDGRTELPHDLGPGESVELDLIVTAPDTPGPAQLELEMVQEFVAWWSDTEGLSGTNITITDIKNGSFPTTRQVITNNSIAGDIPLDFGNDIEMHGLHTQFVRSLFNHCEASVVTAVPNVMAGPEWESFTYFIRLSR